jgi:hypothetical protein
VESINHKQTVVMHVLYSGRKVYADPLEVMTDFLGVEKEKEELSKMVHSVGKYGV